MLQTILNQSVQSNTTTTDTTDEYLVERNITANDIRARILIILQIIKNSIADTDSTIEIEINGQMQTLNLDKSHKYIGGITQIYRDCGLINDDNLFVQKKSKWKIENDKFIVVIE